MAENKKTEKPIIVDAETHELLKAKAKKAGISMKKYVHLCIVMASTNIGLEKDR